MNLSGGFTRRRLLGGLVGGAAAATAAPLLAGQTAGAESPKSDEQIVGDLLNAETLGIAVYEHLIGSPHLPPRAVRVARTVLGQERVHVALLRRELGAPARSATAVPSGRDAIDAGLMAHHVERGIDDVHNAHDALDLLLAVEAISQGAMFGAVSRVRRPSLVALCAEILGSEAQHQAVLGQLRQPKDLSVAVPYAFVEGIH